MALPRWAGPGFPLQSFSCCADKSLPAGQAGISVAIPNAPKRLTERYKLVEPSF